MIVAAGKGTRLGSGIAKQYRPLGNSTSLGITIDTFAKVSTINLIQVVINKDHALEYTNVLNKLELGPNYKKLLPMCFGGNDRTISVKNGLEALSLSEADIKKVLIHDAARPLVKKKLINLVLDTLNHSQAVLPAIPIVDTLWISDKTGLHPGPKRDTLVSGQTPQGFHFNLILEAHKKNKERYTDDISLAYEHGLTISVVSGSEQNFKITTAPDFIKAERYLN